MRPDYLFLDLVAWNLNIRNLTTFAWMGGVLLFTLPLFAGLVQVGRLRRTGLPWVAGQTVIDSLASEAGLRKPVDVLLHESIAAPATCGLGRHAILFPIDASTWSDADVRLAAIHEMEHVRRRDCFINAFARLICAFYWFHPLVWIAWHRLGLEAERACDDAVLRRAEADVYANQLVTLASRLSANARHPLLAMANRSDLVRRVSAVLDERQARGHVGVRRATAIVLAACVLTAVISPLQAVSSTARRRTESQVTAQPAFEVAAIRQNTSGTGAPTSRIEQGRFVASNVPLQQLISDAYRMPVVGGPDWIRDPPGPRRPGAIRFDVIATIPPETPADQVPLMLRTLLAERFKLAVRTETQEREAYELVHARKDKRLGSQLTRSTQRCQTEIEGGPLRAPVRRVTEDGKTVCSIMMGPAAIRGGGLTMIFLANTLSGFVGRTVVDRTGLEGPFDFHLTYTPAARGGGPPPPDDRPSIFTAVQEQLGLKLEAAIASVEMLVIDSVSMPTEN